jgi:hypothetical protein
MSHLLDFSENDLVGSVTYVDTEQIIIEVENNTIMGQICVGNIVAIDTGKQHEHLISLIDKVTRKYIDDFDDDDSEQDDIMISSADYVKVSIVGTYHSVSGNDHDVFKRGVDTFPQIESNCYCISGSNLQNFMNILSKDIQRPSPVQLWQMPAGRVAPSAPLREEPLEAQETSYFADAPRIANFS